MCLVIARYYQEKARQFLSDQMLIDWYTAKPPFNWKTVNSAEKKLALLATCHRAELANPVIVDLIAIVDPDFKKGKGRMKKTVESFLIRKTDAKRELADIAAAFQFWDTEIMAMKALLPMKEQRDENGEIVRKLSPFGNVAIRRGTKEETEEALARYNAPKELFYRYMVVDAPDFRAKTEKYAEEMCIDASEFELLVHGSPTPNMMSLTTNGPKIYPDAPTHGKAYDYGSYFADLIAKSIHYTSLNEYSIYAKGKEPVGVINEYNCARGRAMSPTKDVYGIGYREACLKGGYNCLDARPEVSGYQMREVVFYDERAFYQVGIFFAAYHDEDLRFLDAA